MDTKITRMSMVGLPQGRGESCLVQIYGPDLGKTIALGADDEVAVGRGEGCQIVLELDNVSRRHCSFVARPLGYAVRDEGSTNGTWLNGVELEKGQEAPLRSGDLVKVGAVIFKFLSSGELGSIEAQYHEEIYRLTIIDGLTQVHNKRYLLEFLEREMSRAARHGRPLSVLLLDVDHFKKVNDTHGHLAGDYVLRDLASLVRLRVRREECFARYGGEEFALVLPETPKEAAIAAGDKLRAAVEAHPFSFEGKRLPVTFSAGVAELSGAHDSALAFLKAADERLYAAKKQGRNRVVG